MTLIQKLPNFDISSPSLGGVHEMVPYQTTTPVQPKSSCEITSTPLGGYHGVVAHQTGTFMKQDSICELIHGFYLTEDEEKNAIKNLSYFGDGLKQFDNNDLESYCADDLIDVLKNDYEWKKPNLDQPKYFSTVHQGPKTMNINSMMKCDVKEPLQYYNYGFDMHKTHKMSTSSTTEFQINPITRRKRKHTPLHAQEPPVDEEDHKRWQRAVKAHKHRECKEAQLQNMTEYANKTQAELRQLIDLVNKYQLEIKNITKEKDNYKHRCEKMEDMLKGYGSTVI
ncbi:unnamed protein product [Meganyctiphanes norvegica]|uniref:BZIP domain-containing protein n=1 Tax=Meganyctiphanes norvegica TaxID=48144 RepID=A0AAV2S7M6_MEGNR